jgi:hypothetical protein
VEVEERQEEGLGVGIAWSLLTASREMHVIHSCQKSPLWVQEYGSVALLLSFRCCFRIIPPDANFGLDSGANLLYHLGFMFWERESVIVL